MYLQRSYADICARFNCKEKTAREALKLLESLGVVKRHCITITVGKRKQPNHYS